MNFINEIPSEQLKEFKAQVKEWVELNREIAEYNKKTRELNKKKKELEPIITYFMNNYKVNELNTDLGKVKCCERNTKKGLNKHNIRENLSSILNDDFLIEKAMGKILENRDIVTTYQLKIAKK